MFERFAKSGKKSAKHASESMTPSDSACEIFTPESRFEPAPAFGGGMPGFERLYSNDYKKVRAK